MTTLFSLSWAVPAIWLAYTLRGWWIARRQWTHFASDTKAFYLLVAPPLTLALDLLMVSDKLIYAPLQGRQTAPPSALNAKD